MEAVFSFLKVCIITFGILAGLFILLLGLPQSRLRGITLQIVGWGLNAFTGLCVLYIINPADILPDIIPVLGQVDDAAAVVTALFSGITGILCILQGRKTIAQLPSPKTDREVEK